MRIFIALSLPEIVRNALGDAAANMAYQDKSNAIRWVDQQNYHLTLAFLGEIEERTLTRLVDVVEQDIVSYGVDSMLAQITPFPASKPKLLAAELSLSDSLLDIHSQVNKAVLQCVLPSEKRRFLPHVTLGRIRHSRHAYGGIIPVLESQSVEFDELMVIESQLTPHGAEYYPVFRYPLQLNHELAHDV